MQAMPILSLEVLTFSSNIIILYGKYNMLRIAIVHALQHLSNKLYNISTNVIHKKIE